MTVIILLELSDSKAKNKCINKIIIIAILYHAFPKIFLLVFL